MKPGARQDIVSLRIKLKGPIARVISLIPTFYNKQGIAREGQIRILARALYRAVTENGINAAHTHAKPDLLWIRTANCRPRACRSRERL